MAQQLPLALLCHTQSSNNGDDIQAIAVRRMLHRHCPDRPVEFYLERDTGALFRADDLSVAPPGTKVACVISGWWDGQYTNNFPPSADTVENPLVISFHVNETKKDESYDWLDRGYSLSQPRSLCDPERLALLKNRRVGCRDPHTVRKFHAQGYMHAYLSRCMTMTLGMHLPLVPWGQRSGMYAVDVYPHSAAVAEHIPESVRSRLVLLSQVWEGDLGDIHGKMAAAEDLLDKYRKAQLVITSRLHVALPCLSFGTPVIFSFYNMEDVRFQGLLDTVAVLGRDTVHWDNLRAHTKRPYDWELKVELLSQTVKRWVQTGRE